MAADEITEEYATAMEEAIYSATKAEAERDTALARVAELEAKYEPPRPAGNTPIRIVSGRAYLVKVYTKDGNFWLSRVAGSIHPTEATATHGRRRDGTAGDACDPSSPWYLHPPNPGQRP